ncbi:DUF1415 domain-containing protein [Ramlibacter sp. PS4R-6]|uniref:DUF1415 domain-containing protein n=1 Tax=Ramlibacter sp. PS4R-6 TaxID=3133438 RepID=UPI00309DEE03
MPTADDVHARDTLRWLERAVIGLNLCPFARAVHVKGLVHCAVSAATDGHGVLEDFANELDALVAADAAVRETTLLVVPHALHDFLEFNDFLSRADRLVRKRGLEGVIQVASFHPHYRFEGAGEDDVANCTNRSPWPTLHLLREESITRAVEAFPDPAAIYEANIETLQRMGADGWAALGVGPTQ